MKRPSIRELDKKIKAAKEAIAQGRRDFVNINKVIGELYKLEILDSSEVWRLIPILLREIKPEDYSGGKPPYRSYEKRIKDLELFAFTWYSEHLQRKMYIKFALDNDTYVYVSLHEDKTA